MTTDARIAYDDLDAHPLMRAITDVAAHPGDEHAARRLAGALFSVETTVPIAVAELVLGSQGVFAHLARRGIAPGDRRLARAAHELARLGELAHEDLAGMLDHYGLADAVPPETATPAGGRPPAFVALRDRLVAGSDWDAYVDDIAAFHFTRGRRRARHAPRAAVLAWGTRRCRAPRSDHARRPDRQRPRTGAACDGTRRVRRAAGPPTTPCSTARRAPASRPAYGRSRPAAPTGVCGSCRSTGPTRRVITALFAQLEGAGPRCLVLFDDLVFDDAERTDRTLRAALEGDAALRPDNVVVWATSNRLKLLRETRSEREDDLESALGRGEKAALATRFGLRVAFTQLTQDRYIEIATGLVARLGGPVRADLVPAALRFARGGHGLTPRTARQFAVAWCAGTVTPPD